VTSAACTSTSHHEPSASASGRTAGIAAQATRLAESRASPGRITNVADWRRSRTTVPTMTLDATKPYKIPGWKSISRVRTTQMSAIATAATYRRTVAGARIRREARTAPPPSDRNVTNPTPTTIDAKSRTLVESRPKSGERKP
jgi:hypothetical protein